MKRERGFTLIELMVVIVIIGVLAAIALPRFMTQAKRARESTAWADLSSMTTAMEMYCVDCGTYPEENAKEGSETALAQLVEDDAPGWAGPYMTFKRTAGGTTATTPDDPWGRDYGYVGDATSYTIWCLGRDGESYITEYIPSKDLDFKSP